jgi:hypothetical protein
MRQVRILIGQVFWTIVFASKLLEAKTDFHQTKNSRHQNEIESDRVKMNDHQKLLEAIRFGGERVGLAATRRAV